MDEYAAHERTWNILLTNDKKGIKSLGEIDRLMDMNETDDLSELEIFARTIYGEARGEGLTGQVAVANVIMNRLAKAYQGHSIKEVCLRKYQFSCWLENDPNRQKILEVTKASKIFADCCAIAELAYKMLLIDNTKGAKHYHVTSQGFPLSWGSVKEPSVVIGKHSFYNGVR